MEAIVSIIPIVLLFVLMLGFNMAGHKSAVITLAVSIVLGLFVAPALGLLPPTLSQANTFGIIGWSLVEGLLKAVFPILLIILMAIYSYNILVESRQIEVIKEQFTSISDDRGIIVLILTWGFGGLLEGMAGFGTAVAIPAAILIGLGFKPMFSALVALIANTVPTVFGAVGVPVTTLCNEITPGGAAPAALVNEISGNAVLQLAPLFFILPFVILMLTDRKAIMKNLLLALYVGGVTIAAQYLCARYLGAETPAIIGSVAAIVAIIVAGKVMQRVQSKAMAAGKDETRRHYGIGQSAKAWSVYLLILMFILLSGALCPPINGFLKSHLVSVVHLPVIGSTFKFGWISNAGLMLFLGATIGGLIQGMSLGQLMVLLARTLVNLKKTIVTIVCLISLASVMNYCGMIGAIATGLVAVTGQFYPLFAPLIGAIGTFVTGSDTSSNILFGKLQANVAAQLGFDPTQTNWLVAANTTGASGGKMISPQSIAVATAACDMQGYDGKILKSAIPYALLYIIVGGLMVFLA